MNKEMVARIMANTTVNMGHEHKLLLAQAMTKLLEGWANSFPIRRLRCGESPVSLWQHAEKDREWSASGPGMMDDFDKRVRESVGSRALVFRLSPSMEFGAVTKANPFPAIWVSGCVMGREEALKVGDSFQREIGAGPKEWW